MNRIKQNITTVLVVIVGWIYLSQETHAQCKVDNGDPVKGEFSINGTKVSVKGDGGGSLMASNNVPIKICEGEVITLKNTLSVKTVTSNSYWITELSAYNKLATSLASNTDDIDAKYNTLDGKVEVKLIALGTDPKGIKSYKGPGKYVLTQYDNTSSTLGGPGFHHACQVIEVIAPQTPVVTTSVCSGDEVQVTFPSDPKNNYDDYEITFRATVGSYNPILVTGKPNSYPFTVKSGTLLPDAQTRILSIRGLSITGNCLAPPTPDISISFNTETIFKPIVKSIIGTTKNGEFKLAVTAQSKMSRNLYIRDPQLISIYDYTKNFKTYISTATLTDSIILQVPDGNKMYCFQAEALDLACPSPNSNPNLRSTEEICTTPATVSPLSKKNVITWLPAPVGLLGSVFRFYQVERLNSDGSIDKLFPAILNVTTLKVEDTDVICGNEYTYRVHTNYSQKSYSQLIKVKAVSDDIPSKIPLIYTTVNIDDQNAVNVQGLFKTGIVPTDVLSYHLYKSETKNGIYSLSTSAKMKGVGLFIDKSSEIEKQSYCYYMTYKNLCNIESEPSDKVCTIHLTGNGNFLNWTNETPFSEPVGYYTAYQIDPKTNRPFSARPPLVDNFSGYGTDKISILPEGDGQEIFVQIHAEPSNTGLGGGSGRLATSESNIFKIFRPTLTMSPQIFTPNGDKVNDKFLVEGRFIKSLKITIYDRWGKAIFYDEQTNYPFQANQNPETVIGWDGFLNNGNKAVEGSYVFKIEIEDTIGQISTKEGSLILTY
jgi:hypothetical protein